MPFTWLEKTDVAFEKGFVLISHLGVIAEHNLPKLVLMTGALVRGGMEMQFLDLAREHNQRGGEVVTIGDNGPLEKLFSKFGSFIRVPHPFEDKHQNSEKIISQINSDSLCVMALQSSYFSLIPAISTRSRLLICAHNRPGTFETWLHPESLSRLGEVFRALEADGRLQISASSRSNADRHALFFGLHNDTVQAWYPAIGKVSVEAVRRKSKEFTIGVIARLSPEKLLLVEAALVLLQQAHSQGDNARIIIAGSGAARPDFEACIERSGLSSYVDFIGESTDPIATCRGFDVTVANGRVALEALVAGSRLVTVSVEPTDEPELRLHSVVNLDNIEYLSDENFAPPLANEKQLNIWSDVINIDDETKCKLRDWVYKRRSTSVLYDAFIMQMMKIKSELSNSSLEGFLSYLFARNDGLFDSDFRKELAEGRWRIDKLEEELIKARKWIEEQRSAIDWLADQRDIWEKNAQVLSDQLSKKT